MTESVASMHEEKTLQAWEAYRTAFIKCQHTLLFEDGVAAAKAYRDFLELFTEDDEGGK